MLCQSRKLQWNLKPPPFTHKKEKNYAAISLLPDEFKALFIFLWTHFAVSPNRTGHVMWACAACFCPLPLLQCGMYLKSKNFEIHFYCLLISKWSSGFGNFNWWTIYWLLLYQVEVCTLSIRRPWDQKWRCHETEWSICSWRATCR